MAGTRRGILQELYVELKFRKAIVIKDKIQGCNSD